MKYYFSPFPAKIIIFKFIIKSARLKIKVNFWREQKQHPCSMHKSLFMSSFLNSQVLAKYALSVFFSPSILLLFICSVFVTNSICQVCPQKSNIIYIYYYLFMNSEYERNATSIWSICDGKNSVHGLLIQNNDNLRNVIRSEPVQKKPDPNGHPLNSSVAVDVDRVRWMKGTTCSHSFQLFLICRIE